MSRNRMRAARRKAVIDRWGATCWLCREAIDLTLPFNAPGGFSVDHVVAQVHGGKHDIHNLRPAHRHCNNSRGHRRPVSRGLRVLGGAR